MTVAKLITRAEDTQKDVVAVLRQALQEAEAGEIFGVAIVAITAGNVIRTRSAKTNHRHLLYAGLGYLQHDLVGDE